MGKKGHAYRVVLQEIELQDETSPAKATEFEFRSHDDILQLMQMMKKSGKFENTNDNVELIMGLKLFGGVMMRNKENPLFEEFAPALKEFMKKLKGKK